MAGRECYHCKQWIEEGQAHDCWTTTESALTRDLSEELQDAWERLRETAAAFGDQRIYASHHSIMFSRRSCYFFVRPKKNFLEVCVFLSRPLKLPRIRRVDRVSTTKVAHLFHVRHRDEVEPPVTDWLQEAVRIVRCAGREGRYDTGEVEAGTQVSEDDSEGEAEQEDDGGRSPGSFEASCLMRANLTSHARPSACSVRMPIQLRSTSYHARP